MSRAPLYQYPARTRLDRIVPKQRILTQGKASNWLKARFRDEVEQISWHAKLAHATLNLPATEDVPELQIFVITLKGESLEQSVLRAIDRAIPYPILFELHGEPGIQLAAAYKRPSHADQDKWVVDDHYLVSEWFPVDTLRQPLPMALDLRQLYHQLLRGLLPTTAQPHESLPAQLERVRAQATLAREAARLEKRLRGEKQFNRKIQINAELRTVREKMARYDV